MSVAALKPAMPNNSTPTATAPPITLYVLLAAVLLVFIATFSMLSPILLSVLLVLLISLAINPVISRLRAWTGERSAATGLVAVTLLSVIGLTGWAFSGPMTASVTLLSEKLPAYWERLQKPLIKMEQQAVLSEEKLQAEVTAEIAEKAPAEAETRPAPRIRQPAPPPSASESGSLRSSLSGMLEGVIGRFSAVAFNAGQILVVMVTVLFGVTFTLMNSRPIFGAMFALVPERHHPHALIILQRIARFLPRWAGTTLLGMLTIGLLVFLLMWPILGFMDALVLGLIAGVMEAIPFIGPILSAVPAVLLAIGEGGMTPVWVVLA